MDFKGTGSTAIIDPGVSITGNATVGGGKITSNISGTATYTGAGTITATTIGGQTDFAGNEGTLNINDTGTVGIVTSSIVDTPAGTVNFAGAGTSTTITGNASVNDGTITGGISQNATITGDGQINGSVGGNAAVNSGKLTGHTGANASVGVYGQITGNI